MVFDYTANPLCLLVQNPFVRVDKTGLFVRTKGFIQPYQNYQATVRILSKVVVLGSFKVEPTAYWLTTCN